MDFFGAQDLARRRTWRLAALFGAAVFALVVTTNLLVALVYGWVMGFGRGDPLDLTGPLGQLPATYWAWISAAVVGTVSLASLYKYLWLRDGGRAIAESLGGRLITPATNDAAERRLLNVVEEMAIASGLPVPPVYVIPQPSINAFAAGLQFGDAVIGVNQGTLDHLSRDELQGVIGHEFSHLLNGDSRLNLRLLALLHGILFIGLVGEGLLRGTVRGNHRRSSVSARGGSAGLPILVLGLGLTLIGYAGTLFGRLIKAAVGRQREYLADAAAVQFTRNPQGIAGALKKIGGIAAGSHMAGAAASEASHLFFGPIATAWFGRLTATHPPLEDRIRALDPAWDGRFAAPSHSAGTPASARTSALPGSALPTDADPAEGAMAAFAATPDAPHAPAPEAVAAAVGRVDDAALEQADRLIAGLPETLRTAAHDTWSARALVFALILAGKPGSQDVQADGASGFSEPTLARTAWQLAAVAANLDEARRLVLVEMAVPALKAMSQRQFTGFRSALIGLMGLDRRIDLFEWVLHRVLLRDLESHFGLDGIRRASRARPERHGRRSPVARRPVLGHSVEAAVTLLSALAREQAPGGNPEAAFRAGLATVGLSGAYDGSDDPDFRRLSRALDTLAGIPPLQKPRLIKACAATVLADGSVSARQGALLQGIAAALDCPLPPSIHAGWQQQATAG